MNRILAHAAAILAILGAVAVIAPTPGSSDRQSYQQVGRRLLIRDCGDLHCFRPLVAGVLEHLPGRSLIKWKTYAVVANVLGAIAVARFCLLLGLSSASAISAMWLSAFGAGSLYPLFDSYTSDPLMYMLGPVLTVQLWQGRTRRAGLLAALGLFAKEFAAAPLGMFAMMAALQRRWSSAARLLLLSTGVVLMWLAVHTLLMTMQNYRYGASGSDDLLHGGYLATWLRNVSISGALVYVFTSFSALYLLFPIGWLRSGPGLRALALAAVPVAAAFVYVEQPERALWNFHFLIIPLAVVALQAVPGWMQVVFVASFAVTNLRFGAQLDIRLAARLALLVSLAIAAVAAVRSMRTAVTPTKDPSFEIDDRLPAKRVWLIAAAQAAAFALLGVVLLDVRAHRRDEAHFGVNQWGYRGPLQTAPHPGVRIAVVGGTAAFGEGLPWADTIPAQLAKAINERQGWTRPGGPFAGVSNLAEPKAGPPSYVATLQDYEYLEPDIVCVLDGSHTLTGDLPANSRRRSALFRSVGYLPKFGTRFGSHQSPAAADDGIAPPLQDGPDGAADPSCAGASASYCAAMTDTVRFALGSAKAVVVVTPPIVSARHEAQQRSLAQELDRLFGRNPHFRYVNLARTIDWHDPAYSVDGIRPTAAAARTIAQHLADAIVDVIPERGGAVSP